MNCTDEKLKNYLKCKESQGAFVKTPVDEQIKFETDLAAKLKDSTAAIVADLESKSAQVMKEQEERKKNVKIIFLDALILTPLFRLRQLR